MNRNRRKRTGSSEKTAEPLTSYDWAVWGIQKWTPGDRVVHCNERRRLLDVFQRSLVVVVGFFFAAFIGYQLTQTWIEQFIPSSVFVKIVFFALPGVLIGSIIFFYRPVKTVTLDWSCREVITQGGRKSNRHSFDDIQSVQVFGIYTPQQTIKRQGRTTEDYETYPKSWRTQVRLSLAGDQLLTLAEGREFASEKDGMSPRDRSHQELLPLAEQLAESLQVPWTWKGFEST